MKIEQEPKYDIIDGRIVNRKTGVPIPDNEPVMIFRAKDMHAVAALNAYHCIVPPGEHRMAVAKRIDDFVRFSWNNPGLMKAPDTN